MQNYWSNFLVLWYWQQERVGQTFPHKSTGYNTKMAASYLYKNFRSICYRLWSPWPLKWALNNTQKSYQAIFSDVGMRWFSWVYFWCENYPKIRTETLAQVWTSSSQLYETLEFLKVIYPVYLCMITKPVDLLQRVRAYQTTQHRPLESLYLRGCTPPWQVCSVSNSVAADASCMQRVFC